MSKRAEQFVPEPERFEFSENPIHKFELARRDFFHLLGARIAIFTSATNTFAGQETAPQSKGFHPEELPTDISAWLHISEDGTVTGFTGKVEIGQNIRTSLAQTIADELRVPFESVRMVTADTTLTPFDAGTFGSRSTPSMTPEFRRVASAARDLLVAEAAKKWNIAPTGLVAADGRVTDPASHSSASYGELAQGKTLAQVLPAGDPTTPATQWTIAGKEIPKVGARAFVTGVHQYTPDLRLPGMLHEAQKALDALKVKWKEVPQISNREIFAYLKQNGAAGSDKHPVKEGSLQDGYASAAHRLDATYTVEYIAHAPLEPRAALAQWNDGKLTVWTGTQRPFANRDELAATFHLPESNVRVIVPDMGSAYGGKHTSDAALEAARLARAAGRPVKVVWTREEEFTWAYFRPAGIIEVKGA